MRYAGAALSLLFLALPAMAHPGEWRAERPCWDHPHHAARWDAPRPIDPPWAPRSEDRYGRYEPHHARYERDVIYVDPAPRLVIRPHISLWLGR